MNTALLRMMALALACGLTVAPLCAQDSTAVSGIRPKARPEIGIESGGGAPSAIVLPLGQAQDVSAPAAPRDPHRGSVTNLPLPRFVTLKSNEGNARRGPGRTHRIDWVFTRAGMPLRITAEFENWRRIEDAEGAGGWVHYSLLSGSRSVLVSQDMAAFRTLPDDGAPVMLQAEKGVVARVLECSPDWCRLAVDGQRGWVRKTDLWGVDPGEVVD